MNAPCRRRLVHFDLFDGKREREKNIEFQPR